MRKHKNICVVGFGNWGKNHIKTLKDLNSLGGIVDQSEIALDQARKKYPSCKFFKSVELALKNDFDGYIICTDPSTHYHLAKRIIMANKPVLVEKPLTLNVKDAVSLNNLAKNQNVNLMVGHLLLFHPAFTKIKEMIDTNLIGDIQYMYSNRLNLGTFRSDENVFWSFAPHDIALFNYYFEESPASVSSSGVAILQKDIHDTTITSFNYGNKKMGHIFVSWLHPFKEHRFVIIGSKGMIHFNDSTEKKPLLFYDKRAVFKDGIPFPSKGKVEEIKYKSQLPLTNEIKYFLANLDGKIKINDGDSAVEVIKILEKASSNLSIR